MVLNLFRCAIKGFVYEGEEEEDKTIWRHLYEVHGSKPCQKVILPRYLQTSLERTRKARQPGAIFWRSLVLYPRQKVSARNMVLANIWKQGVQIEVS